MNVPTCEFGFFRFLEAILLFFKKDEKKKVLEFPEFPRFPACQKGRGTCISEA
jgi:hypothetical protein